MPEDILLQQNSAIGNSSHDSDFLNNTSAENLDNGLLTSFLQQIPPYDVKQKIATSNKTFQEQVRKKFKRK